MLNHLLQELTKDFIPISDTPALDAELLVAHVMGRDRNYVLTHPTASLTHEQIFKLEKLKAQREKKYPLAYLTNKKDFWKSEFYVDETVLVPRPETELIVEEVLKMLISEKPAHVIDIGTGSGCIIISLAKENGDHSYIATDIFEHALRTARLNAIKHQVQDKINFHTSDLLESLFSKQQDLPKENLILTANLPYVDNSTKPSPPHEPYLALDGGRQGLELYARFLDQLKQNQIAKSKILLEIDPDQTKPLMQLIHQVYPDAQISVKKDLAEKDRMIRIDI